MMLPQIMNTELAHQDLYDKQTKYQPVPKSPHRAAIEENMTAPAASANFSQRVFAQNPQLSSLGLPNCPQCQVRQHWSLEVRIDRTACNITLKGWSQHFATISFYQFIRSQGQSVFKLFQNGLGGHAAIAIAKGVGFT